MCYWSENHQVLFGTAAYLAGQLWPDEIFRAGRSFRAEGPDAVRPGDLTGRQHAEAARSRLLGWLDDRLRFGFSEWNAPGYYEEDFAALFNLVDFALDEQVRTRAAMAIDLMLFDLARLSHRGSFGVTGGRSHFKHKNCGYQQSTGDLAEVVFATRGAIVDAASGSAGSFASSPSYDVPEVLIRIAVDTPTVISRPPPRVGRSARGGALRHRDDNRGRRVVLVEPRRVSHQGDRRSLRPRGPRSPPPRHQPVQRHLSDSPGAGRRPESRAMWTMWPIRCRCSPKDRR